MANRTFIDLANKRFGRLTVISRASAPGDAEYVSWLCRCDCGTEKIISGTRLRTANRPTRSCGCLQRERTASACRTHGRYKSSEYAIWAGMLRRCTNPRYRFYSDYGGRGIAVCDRWLASFSLFLEDMGERPSPLHTIERIDNDGNYEPGNCRWAYRAEQQKNRRNSRLITYNGRTETAHMWSKIVGFPSRTITNRLNAGWTPERILTTPPAKSGFGSVNRRSR